MGQLVSVVDANAKDNYHTHTRTHEHKSLCVPRTSSSGTRATAEPIIGIVPKRVPPGPSLNQDSFPSRRSTHTFFHLVAWHNDEYQQRNRTVRAGKRLH